MEKVQIKIIPVGILETNCYILSDPETLKGIIVDPGDESEKIAETVEEAGLTIKYIINTHGHYDHIGADLKLKKHFNAQVLVHEKDGPLMENPMLNLSFMKPHVETASLKPDRLLKEGDEIAAGAISLKVIHTPGHTPGCICLLGDGFILTGDTLFAGSAGRTDLPGGSYEDIIESIQIKLKQLPDALKVYPGHGPSSTIGEEKRNNPFM